MLKSFSSGYYRAQMEVQPFADGPAIERSVYDTISRRIYDTTSAPITMRLTLDSGPRFTPHSENAIPRDVIGVPQDILDAAGVHPSDTAVNVFVLKPHAAYRFNSRLDAGADYCYSERGDCQDSDINTDSRYV